MPLLIGATFGGCRVGVYELTRDSSVVLAPTVLLFMEGYGLAGIRLHAYRTSYHGLTIGYLQSFH